MKNIIVEPPVLYYPNFLNSKDNLEWFQKSKKLKWNRGEINRYGKKIPVPREESLFGDAIKYGYRGVTIKAEPWPDFLLDARNRIQVLSGFHFNFAVGNRYLTRKDSIGWHSDDFPQIGRRPLVSSLSLGGTRNLN